MHDQASIEACQECISHIFEFLVLKIGESSSSSIPESSCWVKRRIASLIVLASFVVLHCALLSYSTLLDLCTSSSESLSKIRKETRFVHKRLLHETLKNFWLAWAALKTKKHYPFFAWAPVLKWLQTAYLGEFTRVCASDTPMSWKKIQKMHALQRTHEHKYLRFAVVLQGYCQCLQHMHSGPVFLELFMIVVEFFEVSKSERSCQISGENCREAFPIYLFL